MPSEPSPPLPRSTRSVSVAPCAKCMASWGVLLMASATVTMLMRLGASRVAVQVPTRISNAVMAPMYSFRLSGAPESNETGVVSSMVQSISTSAPLCTPRVASALVAAPLMAMTLPSRW